MVLSLARATSATGSEAHELNPTAVPARAAARATPTSPSGWMAWAPTGEIITGKSMSSPSTWVDRSKLVGRSNTVGEKPSSL